MYRGEDTLKVRELMAKGLSKTDVAKILGIDRKTVTRILNEGPTRRYQRNSQTSRTSKLDPYKEYITQRVVEDGVTNAQVILREIRNRGYEGGYTILKDFMKPLRPERKSTFTVRYETEPGDQAQADWGYFGRCKLWGVERNLWCFAMVLSWSRMLYIEFVFETHEAILQRCHINAFEYFHGVPKRILYDNMKTVAIGRRENGQVQWNAKFLDFAQYYGFQPRVHQPRRPQTKGKVERPMGYIKGNFWQGISFTDIADLNAQAKAWLDQVANVRVHGTTREIPLARWRETERSALHPLIAPPYDTSIVSRRRVSKDGYVVVRTNRYSVPWQYAGQWLMTRETPDGWLEVFNGNEVVALHPLLPPSERFRPVCLPSHHDVPPNPATSSTIIPAAPDVEQRSLSIYDMLANGGELS